LIVRAISILQLIRLDESNMVEKTGLRLDRVEGAATAIVIFVSRNPVKSMTVDSQRAEICLLIASIATYATSFYILYVTYTIPGMDIITATLIGSVMTLGIVISMLMLISAIQNALSLQAFISLVYRTGIVSMAFYFIRDAEEDE
ncbi:1262_t:CDS:2, partial [Scutellospora calospora]